MDVLRGDDIFANYRAYQSRLLAEFRRIGEEYKFVRIDANRTVQEVFAELRQRLAPILASMRPKA
jgi:thymidylate kinase